MYDQPGSRIPVTYEGATPLPHGSPAVIGGHVGFAFKNTQLDRWVKPGSGEDTEIQPGEECVIFVVDTHELALASGKGLDGVHVGDKLWIDANTNAVLTSVTGGSGGSPANEVQTLKVQATGGKIKFVILGETITIKFNASAVEMQAAIDATGAVNPGDVVVSGGPGDEAGTVPYKFTFGGRFADTDVAVITKDDTELTGGEHKSTVATTTAGAGSSDVSLPLGIIDGIDVSRTPHVARVNLSDIKPFIAG